MCVHIHAHILIYIYTYINIYIYMYIYTYVIYGCHNEPQIHRASNASQSGASLLRLCSMLDGSMLSRCFRSREQMEFHLVEGACQTRLCKLPRHFGATVTSVLKCTYCLAYFFRNLEAIPCSNPETVFQRASRHGAPSLVAEAVLPSRQPAWLTGSQEYHTRHDEPAA